jgi:spore germination protein GerM
MKKLILVMLLACAVLLNACGSEQKTEKKQVAEQPVKQTEQVKKEQSFVVYRAAADGSEKLLAEKFTIADNGKSAAENALITLVTTKPQDARMDDVFPIGTKVLGLRVDEKGVAYADFSKQLVKKGQGSYNEMMQCYAIVNTLTEFPNIKKVQIMLEGKRVTTLSGHMDIEEPLVRNISLL